MNKVFILIIIGIVTCSSGPLTKPERGLGKYPDCSIVFKNEKLSILLDSSYYLNFPLDSTWRMLDSRRPGISASISKGTFLFDIFISYSENRDTFTFREKEDLLKYQLADTSQLFLDSRDVYCTFFDERFSLPMNGGYSVYPYKGAIKKFEQNETGLRVAYKVRIQNLYTILFVMLNEQDCGIYSHTVNILDSTILSWELESVDK